MCDTSLPRPPGDVTRSEPRPPRERFAARQFQIAPVHAIECRRRREIKDSSVLLLLLLLPAWEAGAGGLLWALAGGGGRR